MAKLVTFLVFDNAKMQIVVAKLQNITPQIAIIWKTLGY